MRIRVYSWMWLLVIASAATSYSQTSIDLRTQSKTVDFSTSIFTKPAKVGAALPATCSSGEMFFNTTSIPGKNLYACIATNVWVSIGGNDPHTHPVTDLLGITGKQGNAPVLQSFGGGAVGVNDCAKFDSAGNIVSAGAPCGSGGGGAPGGVDGQIQVNSSGTLAGRAIGTGLALDGSALAIDTSIVPQKGTANTFTAGNTFQSTLTLNGPGSLDASTATSTKPVKAGNQFPTLCAANVELFIKTDAVSGQQLYICNSSGNGWNLVGDGVGAGGTPAGSDGQIQVNSSGSFGGRVVGPGLALDASTLGIDTSIIPQKGTANTFTGANTFQAAMTLNGSGSLDASAAAFTRPVKAGIQFPSTCTPNVDLFIKTDSSAGQQLYICNSTGNGWNLVGDGVGAGGTPGGSDGQIQVNSSGSFGGRVVGPGLALDASTLGIDTSIIPQKGTANTFTGANTFQGSLTLNGSGSLDASAATFTKPVKAGIQFPSTCTPNVDLFIKTDSSAGQQLYICNSTGNGWNLVGDGNATPGGADGQLQINSGGAFAGRLIGSGLALSGSALSIDSNVIPQKTSANTFTAPNTFQNTLALSGSGSLDASAATSTRPVKAGTQFPGSCSANVELFIKTDAVAGQQLYICNGSGSGWNVIGDGNGPSLSFGTAAGLGNTTSSGVATTMSRSDHQHKRDVRIAAGGSDVGTRNRINFIQGSNVTLTVEDRPANDEVAVTIASAGAGAGPTQSSQTPAADDCTTDNCTFASSFHIPAGTLTTSKTIDVLATGITVTDGTAPTPRFDLLFGTNPSCSVGTKQFSSVSQIPSLSINSTRQWHVRATFSLKAAGTNGIVLGQGESVSQTNSSATFLSLMRFPGAESGESIDTTVDQWICVRQAYTSGMAGDTVSLKQLIARVY